MIDYMKLIFIKSKRISIFNLFDRNVEILNRPRALHDFNGVLDILDMMLA